VNTRRWPNFFVVGAGRAGTTSLWHYLRQHPDVFMPAMKETHYFTGWNRGFQPIVTTESEYLKLFQRAGSARAVGEASPSYLRTDPVAGRINAAVPDARIIIVVRNPIDRAWSSYWHARRYGREEREFGQALEEELGSGSQRVPRFIRGSTYADSVRRYLELFGDDGVLVLVFEEFAAETRESMRDVYRFLDVDPGFADLVRIEVLNPYSKPRNGLVARIYAGRSVRFLAKRLPLRVQHRAERVALARDGKPALEPKLRRLIAEACIEDVHELEEILGRRLPWDLERELA
jgi:Sulfotransferase domain